jgi:hypothetical protein
MTFSGEPPSPRYRDIGLALLIGTIALIAFLKLGDLVKQAGAVLYFLPARLGLLQQADRAEVWRYQLNTMPEMISFSEPGRYAVYTNDYDLLSISFTLARAEAKPWITVVAVDNGERIPLEFVERGLRPYDSHLAPGRPVMIFTIPRSGFYRLEHSKRPAIIGIARDYLTGREGVSAAVFVAELLLVVGPVGLVFGRRYGRRRGVRRQAQRQRRAEADAAFRRLAERRAAQSAGSDDPDAPFRPKQH